MRSEIETINCPVCAAEMHQGDNCEMCEAKRAIDNCCLDAEVRETLNCVWAGEAAGAGGATADDIARLLGSNCDEASKRLAQLQELGLAWVDDDGYCEFHRIDSDGISQIAV